MNPIELFLYVLFHTTSLDRSKKYKYAKDKHLSAIDKALYQFVDDSIKPKFVPFLRVAILFRYLFGAGLFLLFFALSTTMRTAALAHLTDQDIELIHWLRFWAPIIIFAIPGTMIYLTRVYALARLANFASKSIFRDLEYRAVLIAKTKIYVKVLAVCLVISVFFTIMNLLSRI